MTALRLLGVPAAGVDFLASSAAPARRSHAAPRGLAFARNPDSDLLVRQERDSRKSGYGP
jgi:hypothetical protein